MSKKVIINANDGRIVVPTGGKAYHSYTKTFGIGGELGPRDIAMRDVYIEVTCSRKESFFIKQSDCIELELE